MKWSEIVQNKKKKAKEKRQDINELGWKNIEWQGRPALPRAGR